MHSIPALAHAEGSTKPLPVLAYVVVLASMAALALARQWRSPQPAAVEARSARWAAAGALLFVASDSLLAWDRFTGGLPLASVLVLSTYYGAQYAIARSVLPGHR